MARINPVLIQALMTKMNVKRSRVYARISEIGTEHFMESDAAALLLAKEVGLNPKKFSSPEQRSMIRSSTQRASSQQTAEPRVLQNTKVTGRSTRNGGTSRKSRRPSGDGRSVFVVHGRDADLRKEVFAFLRSINLNPYEWGTALKEARRGANPNVEAVIDACMAKVQAVVVLFSPDEEVRLIDRLRSTRDSSNLEYQPRPNVIFEAGLALGRHPEKTLLIEVGGVRGFSDIAGRHMARLTDDVDSRNDIINRLRILKCDVNVSGTDWMKEGKFPTE